ncbi:hypothetical protein [Streptomyces alboflavus]|uniref:hypothetical protein n=1 Tax=Streptomyces alboflavus TaxID=67267 RepID=UPI003688C4ED
MHRPVRRGRSVLGAAVVLAALSACSDGGGTADEARSPTPSGSATATAAPSPSGSATSSPSRAAPAEITETGDLHRKCAAMGKGFAKAAEYKGKGPHTMVVFLGTYSTDTDSARPYEFWQVRYPGTKIFTGSEDAADIELLACADGTRGSRQVGSCRYSDFGLNARTYPLYDQAYKYTVYELRTGKVVRTLRSSGDTGTDGCPYRLNNSLTGKKHSKVYAHMSRERTEDLLRELVTGPAR